MQISDNSSMPINEYGTNLFRSKFDPLAAFKAKTALRSGKLTESLDGYTKGDELTHMLGKTIENVDLPTQQEAVFPNSALGTQEAPIGYFSSQDPEENPELNPREKDGEAVNESDFLQSSRVDTRELIVPIVNSNISDLVKKREAGNVIADCAVETVNQAVRMGPQRQSERLKKQEKGEVKIADKPEATMLKKNLEGNHLNFKNSFAVLSNSDLMLRSSKMGVDTKDLLLEQFNIIKDLE